MGALSGATDVAWPAGNGGGAEGSGEPAPLRVPRSPITVGSRLSRVRLDHELLIRGWTAADLARESGVCTATISAARHGKSISPRTLRRLAIAITAAPLVLGAEVLLEPA